MELLKRLEKKNELWYLAIFAIVFFFLRLPSLYEPYWYGDEGIYEVIGMALRHGRLLYRDIWDNKPPFLYLIYAIFSGDQTSVRFLSLLSGIYAIIAFYYLAKFLFHKPLIPFIITALFSILFGLPLLEGNIANAENFMLPITITGMLFILSYKPAKNGFAWSYSLFAAGFLFGCAFLFKVVAIFDIAAGSLYLFYLSYKNLRSVYMIFLKLIPLFCGFLLPFIGTVLFFVLNGALKDFIKSAFLMNVGYVNAGNQFIIPQGLLLIKLFFLALFSAFIFMKRTKMQSSHIFIFLWTGFSIFNALFSQRSYTHYLLVFLASFLLFLGLVISEFMTKRVAYIKVLGLSCVFFMVFGFFLENFQFYGKNFTYYQNFMNFITDRKDLISYISFFDTSAARDYELADYITLRAKPSDTLFIWGDNGQLYKLTNMLPPSRYIVAYHVTISPQTFSEEQKALTRVKPLFVVVMPGKGALPYTLVNYKRSIIIEGATIYERIN